MPDTNTPTPKKSHTGWIIAVVLVLLALGVLVYLMMRQSPASNTNTANTSNTSNQANTSLVNSANANISDTNSTNSTPANTNAAGLEQYNRTVITYSTASGTVTGTAGITYDNFDKQLDVVYNFYLTETLEATDSSSYRYAGAATADGGTAASQASLLSTRYCYLDEKASTPFVHYYHDSFRCGKTGVTDKFFITLNGSFATYEEILAINRLSLFRDSSGTENDPATIISRGTASHQYTLIQSSVAKAE